MENRVKRLWIRITESEDKEIKRCAEKMGVSVSKYLRTRIFKSEASLINAVDFLKEYKERVYELKKIGNNINQLARYANHAEKAGQFDPVVIEELNKYLQDFIRCQRETADLNRKILKA